MMTIGDVLENKNNLELAKAIASAAGWAKDHNGYAMAYINALPEALATYGQDGFKTQILYILNNLTSWRGPEARAAKIVLKNAARR